MTSGRFHLVQTTAIFRTRDRPCNRECATEYGEYKTRNHRLVTNVPRPLDALNPRLTVVADDRASSWALPNALTRRPPWQRFYSYGCRHASIRTMHRLAEREVASPA